MNKLLRAALFPFKNVIGIGFSKCKCCGFPWNMVEEHSVRVKDHIGCFAVCEDCWRNKSKEDILKAHHKMYNEWLFGNSQNMPLTIEEIGFSKIDMMKAVESELEKR